MYTYSGVEANDDMAIDITVTYDPKSDQLRFGLSQKQGLASYSAEVAVPSTLKMPYDASQTLTCRYHFHPETRGKDRCRLHDREGDIWRSPAKPMTLET